MKTLIAGFLAVLIAVCAVSTAQAFITIHEGVKSLNKSEHNRSDSSVIGHRVNGQGQFVLVYNK